MAKAKTNNVNSQNSDVNLYTKRTCSDNSELYKQALSTKNLYLSRRNLKKMVQVNHLDEQQD